MAQRTGLKKVLGLAIGEKSLVVAEASSAGDGPARVTLAAAFPYPEGQSLADAATLGNSLGEFLKARGFTARHAVIGVPARWVLSKPKEVPPAEESLVIEALRLQVEGEFSQDLESLTFDYAGETSASEARTVLLVAIQEKHLEQMKSLAAAAKLQLSAVTPVGCVLAAAAANASGTPRSAMVVSVGPGGVEMSAHDGNAPRVLRHLGVPSSPPSLLAGELRRAAISAGGSPGGIEYAREAVNGSARTPVNGAGHAGAGHGGVANGHSPALVLWDDRLLSGPSRQALADAVGARPESGNLERLGVPAGLVAGAPGADGDAAAISGAAALAVAGTADRRLSADFLHSRLVEPKAIGLPRKVVLSVVGGAIILGLAVFAVYDLVSKSNRLTRLQSQITSSEDMLKQDRAFLARVGKAENWHHDQPRFLACILDVHRSIPEDGKTIITNLSLRDNMTGLLQGKTTSDDPQGIVDNLSKPKIGDAPKLGKFVITNRTLDTKDKETTFTVNFRYEPPK